MTSRIPKNLFLVLICLALLMLMPKTVMAFQSMNSINNLRMLAIVAPPGNPSNPHTIAGTIFLEGRNVGQFGDITVSLLKYDSVGSETEVVSTTAATGMFILQHQSLPDGFYVVRGEREGYLHIQSDLIPVIGSDNPNLLYVGEMSAGDLNGDNTVGEADVVQMGVVYGTNDAAADFNADGSVDESDFALVDKNFGETGD